MKSPKYLLLFLFILGTSALTCRAQEVDTLRIQSKVWNQLRRIKVVLPDNYQQKPDERYMVAYLFDAQSEDFFNFYKQTVSYLARQDYIKPLILVGIESRNRQFEFTPQAQTEAGIKYFRKSGGADSLALHLQQEVMPLIASRYRCLNYTIGIGHSLGGTFVTYCLLSHPALFNAGIAISPNYQYDELQLVHRFEQLPPGTQLLAHKYFYLAHGHGDRNEDNFKIGSGKVDSILTQKHFPDFRWAYKPMDNDSHGTTPMEGVFKGLIALFRQFSLPDQRFTKLMTNHPDGVVDSLKTFYATASLWSGLKLPTADEVNSLGYNAYYDKQYKQSLEIFSWALSMYPENANLYDSMGEIQQNTGDKKAAAVYYNKGLKAVEAQRALLDSKTYQELIAGFKNRLQNLNK